MPLATAPRPPLWVTGFCAAVLVLYLVARRKGDALVDRLGVVPRQTNKEPAPFNVLATRKLQHVWIRRVRADGHEYRLHGWHLGKAPEAAVSTDPVGRVRPAVLFFHGNGGTLENYNDEIFRWSQYTDCVYAFDYTGFGVSGAHEVPRVSNLYADARCIFEHVERTVRASTPKTSPRRPLVVVGYSYGTGAAIYLGAHYPGRIAAVVAEAPYRTFKRAAMHLCPWLYPLRHTLSSVISSQVYVHGLEHTRFVVVHGIDDPVCAFEDGVWLYAAASTPLKALFESRTPGHIGVHVDSRVMAWLDTYLRLPL